MVSPSQDRFLHVRRLLIFLPLLEEAPGATGLGSEAGRLGLEEEAGLPRVRLEA